MPELRMIVNCNTGQGQGDWVSLRVTSWTKAESLLIPLILKEDDEDGDEAGVGGRRI